MLECASMCFLCRIFWNVHRQEVKPLFTRRRRSAEEACSGRRTHDDLVRRGVAKGLPQALLELRSRQGLWTFSRCFSSWLCKQGLVLLCSSSQSVESEPQAWHAFLPRWSRSERVRLSVGLAGGLHCCRAGAGEARECMSQHEAARKQDARLRHEIEKLGAMAAPDGSLAGAGTWPMVALSLLACKVKLAQAN